MPLPGIIVQGNLVYPADGQTPIGLFHQEFTEIVMDGLLPLCAPIGLKINPHQGMTQNLTDLSLDTKESMLNIIRNCVGIAFYNVPSNCRHITSPTMKEDEIVSTHRVQWSTMPLGKTPIPVGDDMYIATTRALLEVQFWVGHLTGYRDMAKNHYFMKQSGAENSNIFTADTYVPISSDHTLNRWVRVAAMPAGNAVQVQYMNGMTPEVLQQIWNEGVEVDAHVYPSN